MIRCRPFRKQKYFLSSFPLTISVNLNRLKYKKNYRYKNIHLSVFMIENTSTLKSIVDYVMYGRGTWHP